MHVIAGLQLESSHLLASLDRPHIVFALLRLKRSTAPFDGSLIRQSVQALPSFFFPLDQVFQSLDVALAHADSILFSLARMFGGD